MALSARDSVIKTREWKLMKDKFFEKSLYLTKIRGEGDCLFESFETQIYGKVTGEKIIRKKNVEYITATTTRDDFYEKLIT